MVQMTVQLRFRVHFLRGLGEPPAGVRVHLLHPGVRQMRGWVHLAHPGSNRRHGLKVKQSGSCTADCL